MLIKELVEHITLLDAALQPKELAKHNGVYLDILIKMIENNEPVEVDPAYREQYGDTVRIDPTMVPELKQVLADPANIKFNLPKFFVMLDDDGQPVPNIPWGVLFKSAKFTSKAGLKDYNAGHITEMLMGTAVAAKFINQGKINTHADVFKILQTLIDSARVEAKNYRFNVKRTVRFADKPQPVQVTFTALVPAKSAEALIKQVKAGALNTELTTLFNSAIRYTNESNSIKNSVDRANKQKKESTVEIISDGTTEAKGTKADMTLKLNGEKINLISLKTYSSDTLGQISGLGFEQLSLWFDTSFGIKIDQFKPLLDPALPSAQVYENLITKIYDGYVIGEVTRRVENQTPGKEAEIIERLAHSANYHARGKSMENVEVVKLDDRINKGGYKVLKFSDDLKDAMRVLDLDVKYIDKGQSRTIQIWVKPKEGEEVKGHENKLCQFRTTKMGDSYRNYFEVGRMLEKLVQQNIETTADETPTSAPAKPIKARFEPKAGGVGRGTR
jgi:hypothetical protein